jgi:hypothetical protein
MYNEGGLTCHVLSTLELKYGQFTFLEYIYCHIKTCHKLSLLFLLCNFMLKVTSIITYYMLQKMQQQHGLLHNQLITTEVFLL